MFLFKLLVKRLTHIATIESALVYNADHYKIISIAIKKTKEKPKYSLDNIHQLVSHMAHTVHRAE